MFNKRMRGWLAAVVVVTCTTLGAVGPAAAVTTGPDQGCTPGFWKNHHQAWEEYRPSDPVHLLLGAASADEFGPYANDTLAQALQYKGGSGLDGARRILLRAAVAAYLNAAHESIGYPLRRNDPGFNGEEPLSVMLAEALASDDRQAMLELADYLDSVNNMDCPL